MSENLEFIIKAIEKISKTNRLEGLEGGKLIKISGTKRGFLKNEDILITIEPSESKPEFNAFVKAIINGNSKTENIPKNDLYNILSRNGILDAKLKMKVETIFSKNNMFSDIYHSSLSVSNPDSNEKINQMAVAPLLGFRMHLANSWPNIKDDIEIGFIKGTSFSEIGISHSLGWENEDFQSFFHNGIKLPKALENCKKYGIKKFVILCNGEIMELKVNEL